MTKLRGVRWWMMGLLMIGSIINYLTRSTLAVAAPTVLKDLDITTQQVLVDRRAAFKWPSCCSRSAATSWTRSV